MTRDPVPGDLVLPTYFRISPHKEPAHGIIVRRDGLFYDILWAGKSIPEEYWTTDDFYVVSDDS